jgi:hypothetical protein
MPRTELNFDTESRLIMKHTSPLLLSLLLLATLCLAFVHGALVGAVVFMVLSPLCVLRPIPGRCNVTLTSAEILADVIDAFVKQFPFLRSMGYQFLARSLKLNQTYTAHIPTIPTVEDLSTTYAVTGNDARSLLVDVPITVDKHKGVRLYWDHFQLIQDQKQSYQKIIDLAGYALAKAVIDDLLSGVKTVNFTQEKVYAAADFDLDALNDGCGFGNTNGMLPTGRTLLINTAAANVLSVDSRITNRNDGNGANREVQGNALRRWNNVGGWSDIIEYPDFPTNNGTALTAVTGTATTDVLTKTAHGLLTGTPIVITFASGFTGLTTATKYFVIKVTADTFKLATTRANAEAGTNIDITADGTGATVTPTENLQAFGFDSRAFSLLAGVPDAADPALAAALGINLVMTMEAVTAGDLTMAAAKWQDSGTGRLNWVPSIVWGKALGRQGSSNSAGAKTDYAGIRFITA